MSGGVVAAVLLGGLALIIAAGGTAALLRPRRRLALLDHPNQRSLHERPTPRGGGLAIAAGIAICGTAAAWLAPTSAYPGWIAAGALAVAAVSFLDDLSHVPAALRLVVHAAAAGLLMAGGLTAGGAAVPGGDMVFPGGPGTVALTVLAVVWIVNLYNFMDGMDGFAGGMAVFGFGTFAALSAGGGDPLFTALCVVVAGSAAGFLAFNFPPARIFMGDVGSSLLGFLAAAAALWAAAEDLFPLWIAVLVFSPFIVDATVTLARRAARRERVWQAHREHYYQRLVRVGWGHRRTVLAEYALMALASGSALWARGAPAAGQWLLLAAWVVAYTLAMRFVARLESRR